MKIAWQSGIGLIVSILALGQNPPANGQTVAPDEMVRAALAHSPALHIQEQETAAAAAAMDEARGMSLPQLDARGYAGHYSGLQDANFGPSVTVPAVEDNYGFTVQATQPLFTGGRLMQQRRGASQRHASAMAMEKAHGADTALEALVLYWNWSKAWHAQGVFTASVARMETQFADARNLYGAGLLTTQDVLSTSVQLDRTRLDLEEAGRRVQLARARLHRLTGGVLPAAAQPLAPVLPEEKISGAPGDPLQQRAEMDALRRNLAAAQAGVKIQAAAYYPSVQLIARYDLGRPNMVFFPPTDDWNEDVYAGLNATWTLFDSGATRARKRQAEARRAQAEWQLHQTEDAIQLEVEESRIQLADAIRRAAVSDRMAASSLENYRSAQTLRQNGLTRQSELLTAETQLTVAQYEALAARADADIAQAALRHALGLLDPAAWKQTESKP